MWVAVLAPSLSCRLSVWHILRLVDALVALLHLQPCPSPKSQDIDALVCSILSEWENLNGRHAGRETSHLLYNAKAPQKGLWGIA